jgi:hypothetical protein
MAMLRNTLWVSGLVAALAAAGCDGGDNPAFTVGWNTVYVNSNNAITCAQAGTPTVELTMVNISTQRTYVNRFNCDARGGQSENLPSGDYNVSISLMTQAGVSVSKIDGGQFRLVRDGLTDLGVITFEIQAFVLHWSLAHGPMSLSCKDANATTVNLITRLNSEQEVTYAFPCEAGSGQTTAILLGTYSVGLQLVSGTGAVLWQTQTPMTVPVDDSQVAVLPTVLFDI